MFYSIFVLAIGYGLSTHLRRHRQMAEAATEARSLQAFNTELLRMRQGEDVWDHELRVVPYHNQAAYGIHEHFFFNNGVRVTFTTLNGPPAIILQEGYLQDADSDHTNKWFTANNRHHLGFDAFRPKFEAWMAAATPVSTASSARTN